ncbi:hypothetical protein [Streptomyces sp. NPDC001820]|uniref:hypothetical protein n=1 Tax=Streptomyces sp. NPDC001820 TaxID=3364613 RepID=UPI00369D3EBF
MPLTEIQAPGPYATWTLSASLPCRSQMSRAPLLRSTAFLFAVGAALLVGRVYRLSA